MLSSHDALIVVDPQVDFLPGGALPVPGADAILPAVNRAIEVFVELVAFGVRPLVGVPE
jgi:nicotinamidase/pyrazinamidase